MDENTIILPQVDIISSINNDATFLIEQDSIINRFPASSLNTLLENFATKEYVQSLLEGIENGSY